MRDFGRHQHDDQDTPHEQFFVVVEGDGGVSDMLVQADISREPLVREDGAWGPVADNIDVDWDELDLIEVPESFVAVYEDALDEGLGLERADVLRYVAHHFLTEALRRSDAAAHNHKVEPLLPSAPVPPAGYTVALDEIAALLRGIQTQRYGPINYLSQVLQASHAHPAVDVPFDALVALLGGTRANDQRRRSLHHRNPVMRATSALLCSDVSLVMPLAYDPCVLVRHAVALRPDTLPLTLSTLAEDPFDTVVSALERRVVVDGEEIDLSRRSVQFESAAACSCGGHGADSMTFDEWRSADLEIPRQLPDGLWRALRPFGEWHVATQPFPEPMADYLLASADYLRGPVPDQWAMSHAGHGVNSYALNIRLAVGPLALVAQVAWGGAYGSIFTETDAWNEMVTQIDRLLSVVDLGDGVPGEYRQRRFLIRSSDFGFVLADDLGRDPVRFEVFDGGSWVLEPTITTWDAATRFLAAH